MISSPCQFHLPCERRSARLCAVQASNPQVVRISLRFPGDYSTCSSHSELSCSDFTSALELHKTLWVSHSLLGFWAPTNLQCRSFIADREWLIFTFLFCFIWRTNSLVLRYTWNPNQGMDLPQVLWMKTDVEIKNHRRTTLLPLLL